MGNEGSRASALQQFSPDGPPLSAEAIEQLLTHFDADGSGFLEKGEIDTLLVSWCKLNKVQQPMHIIRQKFFARYDADHDGRISKPELLTGGSLDDATIVVLQCEGQRHYGPLVGWSNKLLLGDGERWASIDGDPTPGDKWHPAGVRWVDTHWNICRSAEPLLLTLGQPHADDGICDQDGWRYAVSFPDPGKSIATAFKPQRRFARDHIRRRYWMRRGTVSMNAAGHVGDMLRQTAFEAHDASNPSELPPHVYHLAQAIVASGLLSDRVYRKKAHPCCLVGRDLVGWLIVNDFAFTRPQAVRIGSWLEHWKVLEHCACESKFRDDDSIYCFTMPPPPAEEITEANSAIRFEFRVVVEQLDVSMDLRCVVALKVRGEKTQEETPDATGEDGCVRWGDGAVLTTTVTLSVGDEGEKGESEQKNIEPVSPPPLGNREADMNASVSAEAEEECARAPFARKRANLIVKTLDRQSHRRFLGEVEIDLAQFANQQREETQTLTLPLKRCAVEGAQLRFTVHCRPLDACLLTSKDHQRAILMEVAADMADPSDKAETGDEDEK